MIRYVLLSDKTIRRYDDGREAPRAPIHARVAKENSPQALLIALVRDLGGKATKINGENGTPDVLLKVPGFPMTLVEMKRKGEEPEPAQILRRVEWTAVGAACTWCAGAIEVYSFMRLFDR